MEELATQLVRWGNRHPGRAFLLWLGTLNVMFVVMWVLWSLTAAIVVAIVAVLLQASLILQVRRASR